MQTDAAEARAHDATDARRRVVSHGVRVSRGVLAIVLALGSGLAAHATYVSALHASYLREHVGPLAELAVPVLALAATCAALALVSVLRTPLVSAASVLGVGGSYTALAWLGVLAWEQPPRPLVLELLGAGLALLLGVVVLLERRGIALAPRIWAARAPRWFLKACASLALVELLLRGVDRVYPHPLFVRESTTVQQTLRARRPPPGTRHHGYECNRLGHYDVEIAPPPRERALAVCIGDSFSAGVVPHMLHYTTVAERELAAPSEVGPEIYNMGVPGIDVPEYIWLLEHEALPLEPELVVIALFVGNDIAPARRSHDSWTTQLFERENMLAWVVPRRLATLEHEGLLGADDTDEEGELRRSRREPLLTTLDEITQAIPWTFEPRLERPSFTPDAFLEIELDRANWICSPDLHDYEQLYEWLALLVAAAGDAPLCFLILPDEFQVEDAVWDEVLAHPRGAALDRDQPQRLIGAWLERRGIAYCDPLGALRAVDPLNDGRRHLYHMRDTHLNARGNRIVGLELAKFLEPRLRALRPWGATAAPR